MHTAALQALAGGSACTTGTQVKICVEWSRSPNPVDGVDFVTSFSNPSSPSIQLLSGDLAWVVSAELLSNGDPANITSITTPASDNFVVKIAKGSGPGAANVGAITLQPTGSHYSSVASGSRISGNLTGNLTVLRNSGTGGEATLTVDGNVASTSTITVPVLKGLTITGDLAGDINVTTAINNGGLLVLGSVANTSTIDIADMTGKSSIACKRITSQTFGGHLILRTGLPADQALIIDAPMTSDGVVDFNGGDIAYTAVIEVGAGTVVNGGVVRANVTIASQFDLTGSVTVSGVADDSDLNWECPTGVYMNGTLHVTGDVVGPEGAVGAHSGVMHSSGQIIVDGNVTGVIQTSAAGDGGNMPGVITVGGDLSGNIYVNGDLSGSVEVGGDVSGDIKVLGDVTGPLTVDGRLMSTGRVLIDGICSSTVRVKHIMQALSLIRMTVGLGSDGLVDVNPNGTSTDTASGTLYFGSTSVISPPFQPVTFDGQVRVNHFSGGATWTGAISVNGCHATNAALDICICGTNSGSLRISQSGCSVQVPTTPTCSSSCP